jgi:ribosomal protein S18 acetylase RimI-like enzyme
MGGERVTMITAMNDAATDDEHISILRAATEADYPAVANALQTWWTQPGLDTPSAARERAALVPRLWLQHFATTSVIAERGEQLHGFLIALYSQDRQDEGYIHFVGVAPSQRGRGIGRRLYERFFESCRATGRSWVRCVTSPTNTVSIGFHEAMGFAIERSSGAIAKPDYDGPGVPRVAFVRSTSPTVVDPSGRGHGVPRVDG